MYEPGLIFCCATCGANWTAGAWAPGCEECGGGAMDKACEFCGGRCGARMQRAAVDSQDAGRAQFFGRCLLADAPG